MYKCMGAHPNTNTIAYQHRVLMENVFSDSIESDGEGVEESRADSIGHEAPDEVTRHVLRLNGMYVKYLSWVGGWLIYGHWIGCDTSTVRLVSCNHLTELRNPWSWH